MIAEIRRSTDKRYGSSRWKRTRLRVLHRDLWRCYVPSCDVDASVADHIEPVFPGMPDAWFFEERNLRASCRRHNTARGVAARLARDLGEAPARSRFEIVVSDYSRKPRIG